MYFSINIYVRKIILLVKFEGGRKETRLFSYPDCEWRLGISLSQ